MPIIRKHTLGKIWICDLDVNPVVMGVEAPVGSFGVYEGKLFMKKGTYPHNWVEIQTNPNGFILYRDNNGNLVCNVSGDLAFDNAEEIIFDFRKDGESYLYLNMPMCDENFDNYSTFDLPTRVVGVKRSLFNGPDGSSCANFSGSNINYIEFENPLLWTEGDRTITLFFKRLNRNKDVLIGGRGLPGTGNSNLVLTKNKVKLVNTGSPYIFSEFISGGNETMKQWCFLSINRMSTESQIQGWLNDQMIWNEAGDWIDIENTGKHRLGRDKRSDSEAFKGWLSGLFITKKVISQSQRIRFQNRQFNVIDNNELSSGEWTCLATPVNNGVVGEAKISNPVII